MSEGNEEIPVKRYLENAKSDLVSTSADITAINSVIDDKRQR